MGNYCKHICRIDDAIAFLEDVCISLVHGLIAFLVVAAVLFRYLLNDPLTWGEELIVALFTWMVFIGAAAAIRSQMHIRIDVMAPVFRMPKFHWLNTVTLISGISIIVTMILACYELMLQELVVDSPMMGVSKAWFVAGMPTGLVLMLIHVLRIWMAEGPAPVFRGETETLVIKEGASQ